MSGPPGRSTPPRSRGWIAALAAAAVAASLYLAAPALAASPRLTQAQAIQIAAADPLVAQVQAANLGAHWQAFFHRSKHQWLVVLEPLGKNEVLASVRIDDATGKLLGQHIGGGPGPPRLTASQAARLALRSGALRSWLGLYQGVSHSADLGDDRVWTISYYAGSNEIAEVRVDDTLMALQGVRTGPQVGWMLARGEPGSYGRLVNRWWLFIPLCALFVAGLMNWRRPFSLRTLDLLVLVSFGISLIFFDHANLFLATPLVYPPMIYLIARGVRVGFSHAGRGVDVGPTHALVLVALTFGLIGFRLGLNNQNSNILDVGYASVVGADRLLNRTVPYGHMPSTTSRPCGGRYGNGDPIGYIQADGHCESPVGAGDTYGPAVYLAYVPAVAAVGWSGKWDSVPAAHVAACAFDLLAIAGLFVAGWWLANARIGVLMAFAWAANPFTLYALNMNTNDALVGALLAWAMALLSIPAARGALLAAAGLAKLGPLALIPLFLSLRRRVPAIVGFVVTALALSSFVLFAHNGLRVFWDRTISYQLHRVTPMSLWTIGSYHPGWPNLHWVQQVAQVAVIVGCLLLFVLPRGPKDAAQVAALGGAALIATQAVASYWFYPYICWWLPMIVLGLLLPRGGREGSAAGPAVRYSSHPGPQEPSQSPAA